MAAVWNAARTSRTAAACERAIRRMARPADSRAAAGDERDARCRGRGARACSWRRARRRPDGCGWCCRHAAAVGGVDGRVDVASGDWRLSERFEDDQGAGAVADSGRRRRLPVSRRAVHSVPAARGHRRHDQLVLFTGVLPAGLPARPHAAEDRDVRRPRLAAVLELFTHPPVRSRVPVPRGHSDRAADHRTAHSLAAASRSSTTSTTRFSWRR